MGQEQGCRKGGALPPRHSSTITGPLGSMGPSDFRLFRLLKKHQASKKFATDTNMKQAVTSWLQTPETDFFYARTQTLMLQSLLTEADLWGLKEINNTYRKTMHRGFTIVSQHKCVVVRIYSIRNCEHTRKIKFYNHHFTSPTNLSIHSKAFKHKKVSCISTRFWT